VFPGDADFRELCQDILLARSSKNLAESTQIIWDLFNTYQKYEVVPETTDDDSHSVMRSDESLTDLPVHPELVSSAEDRTVDSEAVDSEAVDSGTAEEMRLGKPDPEVPLTNSPGDDTLDEIFGDEESLESGDGTIAPHIIQEALDHVESDQFDASPATFMSDTEVKAEAEIIHEHTDHRHGDEQPIPNGSISSVTFAPGEDIPGLDDMDMALADTLEISQPSALSPETILGDDALSSMTLASPPHDIETLAPAGLDDHPDEETLSNAVPDDVLNTIVPSVPFEREVYAYLLQSHDARPSQIEAALGISRFQTVNALRSLTDKGLIASHSSHTHGHSSGGGNGNGNSNGHGYSHSSNLHSSINGHIRGHILPPHSPEMPQPRMMHGGDAL
jgi:hypothetical protein